MTFQCGRFETDVDVGVCVVAESVEVGVLVSVVDTEVGAWCSYTLSRFAPPHKWAESPAHGTMQFEVALKLSAGKFAEQ